MSQVFDRAWHSFLSKVFKVHETRGGPRKRKCFVWDYVPDEETILILNEQGIHHRYTIPEIIGILETIHDSFGDQYFPLANNVERLRHGTERLGLGSIILARSPGDVSHAQGSSYLGVVLEGLGYFAWNNKMRGIEWRLINFDFSRESIINRLKTR